MKKEEATMVKETNNTDASKWVVIPKSAFLAVLHVLFLIITLVAHPPIETGAAKSLP
jgi:hypothetical protein